MIEKGSTCCFYESGSCEDLIRTLAALIGDCQPCPIAKVFSQQARQHRAEMKWGKFFYPGNCHLHNC